VETTSQLVNGKESTPLPARVRDISRGGIQLVVKFQCETGALVSIELPGAAPERSYTVLACVVRVSALPNNEWALGCTFPTELSDRDLEPFGARRLRHPPPDKRTWVRFPCQTQASYHLVRGAEAQLWPAQVADISTCGIGLRVSRPVDVGTLLSLDLRGGHQPCGMSMLASVVRVTPQTGHEWALGCNFIRELSDEELQALI
jgi:hypothetical protein